MWRSHEEGARSRRGFLVALGTAGVAGVAGCKGVEYPDESDDDEQPSPPGTDFGFAFDASAGSYSVTNESDASFDADNTGLLAVDHVAETGTTARTVWFGEAGQVPVSPGSTSTWGYDAEHVTTLEVVWAPPGSAGSGRAPEILARRATP